MRCRSSRKRVRVDFYFSSRFNLCIFIAGLRHFKFLKNEGNNKQGSDLAKTDYAQLQRHALVVYLIRLIRAVVRPHPFSSSSTL